MFCPANRVYEMAVRISKLSLPAMFALGLTLLAGSASAIPNGEVFVSGATTISGSVPISQAGGQDCIEFSNIQVHTQGVATVGATTTDAQLLAERRNNACTSSSGYHIDAVTEWEVTDLIFTSSTGGGGSATVDLNYSASGNSNHIDACNFVVSGHVETAGSAKVRTHVPGVGPFSIQNSLSSFTVELDTPLFFRWGFSPRARCTAAHHLAPPSTREMSVELTVGHGSGIFTVTSGDIVSIDSVQGDIANNRFGSEAVPALSGWGMVALAGSLLTSTIWVSRRALLARRSVS